jgi:hypothetical protein
MGIYLGNSEKLKINLGDATYIMNIFSALPTIEDIVLSSSDDCILKDFNGLYLSPLAEEEEI